MKTAIISGISGQDGAYLAKLLVDKNYRVVGLIRPLQSKNRIGLAFLGIQQQVELQEINLLNKTEVEKLIQQIQPDEFYNLAAQSSVGLSFTTPVVISNARTSASEPGCSILFSASRLFRISLRLLSSISYEIDCSNNFICFSLLNLDDFSIIYSALTAGSGNTMKPPLYSGYLTINSLLKIF